MNSRRIAIGAAALGIFAFGVAVGQFVFVESDEAVGPDRDTPVETGSVSSAPPTSSADEATPSPAAKPARGGFVGVFDGNTGLGEFRHGVFHRDVDVNGQAGVNGSWTGDHDLDCGPPATQRALDKNDRDGSFYMCRDHLMTSMVTSTVTRSCGSRPTGSSTARPESRGR